MAKIGRNEPCPCASGKKYKKCHGNIPLQERVAKAMAIAPILRARSDAREYQRVEQQGLGKPVIAAKMENGYQFVAVQNRLYYSKNWKTFHDFLGAYLIAVLGPEWGNAALQKPLSKRHPILVWYHHVCEQQQRFVTPGTISSAEMTGGVAAFMYLAYDLYALDHNAELQAKLIKRLHDRGQFSGARYEVHVAAILVRAGFSIEFENEDDRNTTHCEFTATHNETGRKFSVEVKRSGGGGIIRQLWRALKKAANHPRIVFVDLNVPEVYREGEESSQMLHAFNRLLRYEAYDPQVSRLPSAYVVLTNIPWEHDLDRTSWKYLALGHGFKIPEFRMGYVFPSIRQAIDARQAHLEIHGLLKSIENHSHIPSTFDGDNPDLAFTGTVPRLSIGERYLVPNIDGVEVNALLTSAIVLENEGVAACAMSSDDGQNFVVKMPLSDAEMAAWKRHPETFFGELSGHTKVESPLEFYDAMMDAYGRTPKERLLEFMAGASDFERLARLEQPELARVYCERTTMNAVPRIAALQNSQFLSIAQRFPQPLSHKA
ncbi:MAG: SEC-C metal-binding domain-containing protein [Pusillimonas sp.]